MNFQTIVGILLISLAVGLTSFVFGAVFGTPLESMNRPLLSAGYQESPSRFEGPNQASDSQGVGSAMAQSPSELHPPIVVADFDSVPADQASISTPEVSVESNWRQTNPIQMNAVQMNAVREKSDLGNLKPANPIQASRIQANPAQAKSRFEIPARVPMIPQPQLLGPSVSSDTDRLAAVPNVSQGHQPHVPKQPCHSDSELQQDSRSALQEHFSTGRSKYLQNRYVNSEGQQTLADRVLALERNSLTRDRTGSLQDKQQRSPTAVQQASYESKFAGPGSSVLMNEPGLSGTENVSEFDSVSRVGRSETGFGFETQRSELPRQIAPINGAMGMSIQQPALQRLRVSPQVETRAREHIEYGESLARRNSYLAAREEFTLALLLIARSHKTPSDPEAYLNRLAQGLTALDEAADFSGPNVEWSKQGVLQQKVLSHKTKLISPNNINKLSRTRALDLYYGFAQSQIELAIGYSAAGSAALHTLGKIETRSSLNSQRGDWTGQARALVFLRAAMSCNPGNADCANELGVLLHDMGRLKEAEQALKVAIASSPSRSAWANLAAVHSQLAINAQVVDERDRNLRLAKLAATRAEQSGFNVTSNGGAGERWATTSEFHNNAAFPNVTTQRVPQSRGQNPNQRNASAAKTLLKKVRGLY